MTPIEKNIIVVDEQGREYEATYLKRAKGLVKNGRARFVGENKICLACPPDKIMEETEMEDNKLTAKEIFEQLTILQKQLTENSQTSLHRLSDAIESACGDEGDEGDERNHEQIAVICDVFNTREVTLLKLLGMYEKMYNDVQNEENRKADMISRAFEKNMAYINDADISSEDKYAALGYVTDKIAELVAQLVTAKKD